MHFRPLLLLVVVMTSACSRESDKRNTNMLFRYNEAAGISSLDPAFARAQSNIWPVHQLFSTLIELDSNLNVTPGLAYDWNISDDGTTYTFFLRKEVEFHPHPAFRGKRTLVAGDVIYSLSRLRDPALSSPGAWTTQWVDSMVATDDFTLIIQLKQAFSPFLRLLTMKYCSVVPREAVEYSNVSFAKSPSGTGPFYLKRWITGEKLIMRRFENHYEKCDSLAIQGIVVRFIPDKLSAFLSFLKGDLDFISGLDVSYRDDIIDEKGKLRAKYQNRMLLKTTSYLNTEYLAFDTQRLKKNGSPYADPKIRKAIHYAIDKEKMVRYLMRDMGTPARTGMTPPALLPANTSHLPRNFTNRDSARLWLAEAGYPGGNGLPEIVLSTNPGYQDMAEFIQSEAQSVGIPVKVDVSPPATLRQAMATGKLDWFRASWIADYPDTENYMLLFCSEFIPPAGPNYSRFSSLKTDKLYQQLAKINPSSQRDSIFIEMENSVAEETPVIPLFYDQVIRLVNPRLRNFPINALNMLELRNTSKVPVEK